MTAPQPPPPRDPVIAVDGPAASGKGTLARRLAGRLGWRHLDSGKLYRATARDALRAGVALDDAEALADLARALDLDSLGDPDLRRDDIGGAASRVAPHPAVREALLSVQRAAVVGVAGLVIDGRDIGSVVFPQAAVKLFVEASLAARVARRAAELESLGLPVDIDALTAETDARDRRDRSRTVAPLAPAVDALLLDTSDLSIDEVFEAAWRLAAPRLGLIRAEEA